jgi:hypothetical protein
MDTDGTDRLNSGTVVRESSDGLTLNVGSLSTSSAAMLLPGPLGSEWPSAGNTRLHGDSGIGSPLMRHTWLKGTE